MSLFVRKTSHWQIQKKKGVGGLKSTLSEAKGKRDRMKSLWRGDQEGEAVFGM